MRAPRPRVQGRAALTRLHVMRAFILYTTSAQGVACRWTHYQQSLWARALPKSAAAGHRGAPICSQAARVVVSTPHGGPRPWPRPADEGVARTCGAAAQRLNSGWTASSQGSVGRAATPMGSQAVRCRRGGGGEGSVPVSTPHGSQGTQAYQGADVVSGGLPRTRRVTFRVPGRPGRLAVAGARASNRPTTACKITFHNHSLPATRRGGTRPTGAQYFSARGESVHGFPAHTLLSALPLCEVGAARAARWRILPFHVRIGPQKLSQYEFRLATVDERVE